MIVVLVEGIQMLRVVGNLDGAAGIVWIISLCHCAVVVADHDVTVAFTRGTAAHCFVIYCECDGLLITGTIGFKLRTLEHYSR